MTVKVTGLQDVLDTIDDVSEANAKKLTASFCMDVAQAIVDTAKPLMPRDTGQMAALTVAEPGKGRYAGSASVRVGSDAYYWRFLEYGDGPDGIEHAFFMRARETVFSRIDDVAADRFKAELSKLIAGR